MSHKSSKNQKHHNHLINEKSPYLIQHAENPVDWYPWGEEAFKKAEKENKLIFLSIGYSTCHWCHVMARESFEDVEVAQLMNQVFVSIKVDREERPDIDSTYMTVSQMITGSGGWPLTILMTPDKKPFFAGTYFPKESVHGRVGLKDLILNVRDMWAKNKLEVINSADQLIDALMKISNIPSGEQLDVSIFYDAYKQISRNFDETYGGFGSIQKFPTPHNLFFLLRYWKRSRNKRALHMVEKTLDSMRNGGIYDHVGSGFHRYSVDQRWLVPHFEKMLYDQALIAMAYIEAFQATGKKEYKETTQQIFQYVIRDMQSPEGGFYSAEDAESEGVEGKFYLWTKKELFKVLDEDEVEFAANIFNIKEDGNFQEEATGRKIGANILHLKKSVRELAEEYGVKKIEIEDKIEKIRKKLFDVRQKRVHPHKDDKILTDWNGLMIAALAKGSQVLNNEEYSKAAVKTVDFILNKMYVGDRLLHRYRDKESAITGNLDDYAFMIWGLLELYESTFQVKYLKDAIALNEAVLEHFLDKEGGGFYFTPDDSEDIILRKKEIYDGSTPSGNSVEMLNLIRLAKLTENPDFEAIAAQMECAFSKNISRTPAAHIQFMIAIDFKFGPSYEVTIVGNPDGEDTRILLENLRKHFSPNKTVLFVDFSPENVKNRSRIIKINSSLKLRKMIEEKATAYICVNKTCKPPTTSPDQMLNLLEPK